MNRISKLLTSNPFPPAQTRLRPAFFPGMDVAPAWMKEEPLSNAAEEGIVLHLTTYRAWLAIRRRHLNGGVAVCERWEQFECFLADMGTRPRGTRLVRIDKGSAYGPTTVCGGRTNDSVTQGASRLSQNTCSGSRNCMPQATRNMKSPVCCVRLARRYAMRSGHQRSSGRCSNRLNVIIRSTESGLARGSFWA